MGPAPGNLIQEGTRELLPVVLSPKRGNDRRRFFTDTLGKPLVAGIGCAFEGACDLRHEIRDLPGGSAAASVRPIVEAVFTHATILAVRGVSAVVRKKSTEPSGATPLSRMELDWAQVADPAVGRDTQNPHEVRALTTPALLERRHAAEPCHCDLDMLNHLSRRCAPTNVASWLPQV